MNINDQESCRPELPCEDCSGQHHPDPGAKVDSWTSLYGAAGKPGSRQCLSELNTSHLLLLGKFEYGGGPIFKVVLEC